MPKKINEETPKPEPIAKNVVCSVCDCSWKEHDGHQDNNVSIKECIRLLKQKAIMKPYTYTYGGSWPTTTNADPYYLNVSTSEFFTETKDDPNKEA